MLFIVVTDFSLFLGQQSAGGISRRGGAAAAAAVSHFFCVCADQFSSVVSCPQGTSESDEAEGCEQCMEATATPLPLPPPPLPHYSWGMQQPPLPCRARACPPSPALRGRGATPRPRKPSLLATRATRRRASSPVRAFCDE